MTHEVEPQPLLPVVHATRQAALDCDLGHAPRHARLQTLEAMLLAAYIKLATRHVARGLECFELSRDTRTRASIGGRDSADATRVLVVARRS